MVSFKKLRQMIEVQGNGNIVSREISISTFFRLHLGCKGRIELYQGDEERVVVETDENLLEYFEAANAGRTLYITNVGNLKRPVYTSCVIKVYFSQLNLLYLRNTEGNVVCPEVLTLREPLEIKAQGVGQTELFINAPSIKFLNQANGNTILKGQTGKLEIRNQCNGDFNASQMVADELTIKNMANGNVWLHAEKSITLSHYGNGFIHYSGNAVVKDIKHYGHGEVKRTKQAV